MAASNTFSYHCHGPIVPQCSLSTGGTGYAAFGVAEDGADIQIQVATKPIKPSGAGGPDGFETNEYYVGMSATIRFTLVPFGGSFVNVLRAMSQTGTYTLGANPVTATDGQSNMPGRLYRTGSGVASYTGLYLPVLAGEGDGPWWFPTCRVVRAGDNKVSPQETKPVFEFRAVVYFNPSQSATTYGNYLYKRIAPT